MLVFRASAHSIVFPYYFRFSLLLKATNPKSDALKEVTQILQYLIIMTNNRSWKYLKMTELMTDFQEFFDTDATPKVEAMLANLMLRYQVLYENLMEDKKAARPLSGIHKLLLFGLPSFNGELDIDAFLKTSESTLFPMWLNY